MKILIGRLSFSFSFQFEIARRAISYKQHSTKNGYRKGDMHNINGYLTEKADKMHKF